MLKTINALFMMGLLVSFNVHAEDKEEAPSVAGIWLISAVEIDGEAIDDDDLGRRIVVLSEDGKSAAYDNEEAYSKGEPDDVGWYELDKEGNISVFEDRNENGELDEEDRASADKMSWKMDKKNLVLMQTMGEGEEETVFKMTLTPYQPDKPSGDS